MGVSLSLTRCALIVALLSVVGLAVPGLAQAQEPNIDWQRGLLVARTAVPGDLGAPNREMARIKAERQARARCRATLRVALKDVPTAPGLKASALPDDALPLLSLATDYGMDGSVVIEMALPLDALRTLYGAGDPLVGPDAAGPAALIIDARRLPLKRAVGYAIGDGDVSYRGPSLFFADEDTARQDGRIGKSVKILVASSAKAGTIRVPSGALKGLLDAQPLVVILTGTDKKAGKQ